MGDTIQGQQLEGWRGLHCSSSGLLASPSAPPQHVLFPITVSFWLFPQNPPPGQTKPTHTSPERVLFFLRTYHFGKIHHNWLNSHSKQRDPCCLHNKRCQPGSRESTGPEAGQGSNHQNPVTSSSQHPPPPASHVPQLAPPAKRSTAFRNSLQLRSNTDLHESMQALYVQTLTLRDPETSSHPCWSGGRVLARASRLH